MILGHYLTTCIVSNRADEVAQIELRIKSLRNQSTRLNEEPLYIEGIVDREEV